MVRLVGVEPESNSRSVEVSWRDRIQPCVFRMVDAGDVEDVCLSVCCHQGECLGSMMRGLLGVSVGCTRPGEGAVQWEDVGQVELAAYQFDMRACVYQVRSPEKFGR